MSSSTPPPNLPADLSPDRPPQAPPGVSSQAQPAAQVRFELVEQLIAQRARGEQAATDQLVAGPVQQLQALRGQVPDAQIDSALKGFAAIEHLIQSLAQAKTDAAPIPPI